MRPVTPRRAHLTRAQGVGFGADPSFSPRRRLCPCPRPLAKTPPPSSSSISAISASSPAARSLPPASFLPSLARDPPPVGQLSFGRVCLNPALKVLDYMCQWIKTRFLTPIFSVSSVQHLEESFRVLRQVSFVLLHPERVPSSDRKPFAPVPYLFLRSIGLSHL